MSSFVPESFQKKVDRTKKEATDLKACRDAKRKALVEKRKEWAMKAQNYSETEQKRREEEVLNFRKAKAQGDFYIPPEAKVLFIVRIKGITKIAPKAKSILRLLRLRQINNAVFMKVNTATWQMLRRVEPYVTYGFPTRKTVSDLIYTRGYGKMNRCRIPLTDNSLIEASLGKHKVNCVEDVVETIYTCGNNFKEVNNFLWPFKLDTPKGGWANKNKSFMTVGDWGNRENAINDLVRRML